MIVVDVTRAVDLCAAPGSWSQLLAHRLRQNIVLLESNNTGYVHKTAIPLVVSVDLQEMAPIEDCSILQGDITLPTTADRVVEQFQGELAHLVVCDGAPDVTGFHAVDEHLQSQLLFAALAISARVLEVGGSFVAKIFKGDCEEVLVSQMYLLFEKVDVIKPSSSRPRSAEHFIVGTKFRWDRGVMRALMVAGDAALSSSRHTESSDIFRSEILNSLKENGQLQQQSPSQIDDYVNGMLQLWSVLSLGSLNQG